jgi:peptidoglycan/LPS O-acetylase OafA/YrhL
VGFFFLLSGFLAGYSAEGKAIRFNVKEYAENVWKRVCRLYPLYFITMMIPVIYSDELVKLAMMKFDGDVIQLLKNLLMIQSWFTEGSMTINSVGWYVSTLMFLSLFTLPVTCLLQKVKRNPGRPLIFAGIAAGVFFLTAVYCYLTKTWDLGYWHYVFPPARLGEYVGGIALGYGFSSIRPMIKTKDSFKWLFTILEIGALLFSFVSMYHFGSPWRVHILNWLIPNCILIGVFALGEGWVSGMFRARPLVRLGDISYECFLVHNIIVIGMARSNPELADTRMGKTGGFIFGFLLSIVISLYLSKQKNNGRKQH